MKRLIFLAILTCIALWFTLDSLNQNQAETMHSRDVALFAPKLGSVVSQIKRIELTKGNEDKLILILDEHNDWRVATRSNFPAKNYKVQHLIDILSASTLIEEKTGNPELWQHLGLDADNAIRVKMIGNEPNAPLFDAYIGSFKQSLGGTYLRHVLDQKSWLSSGEITLEILPSYWLRQELFSIPETRIKHILAKHMSVSGTVQTIEIARNAPSDPLAIINKPSWATTTDSYHMNILAAGFNDVVLADVQASKQQAQQSQTPLELTLTTFDGLELHLLFYNFGDKWAKISAHYRPEQRWHPAASTVKPSSILSENIVKAQVDAINRRTENWLFLLPTYSYSMLSRSPESIFGKNPTLGDNISEDERNPANSSGIVNVSNLPKMLGGFAPKTALSLPTTPPQPVPSSPLAPANQHAPEKTYQPHYSEEALQRIKDIEKESKNNPEIRKNADMINKLILDTKVYSKEMEKKIPQQGNLPAPTSPAEK